MPCLSAPNDCLRAKPSPASSHLLSLTRHVRLSQGHSLCAHVGRLQRARRLERRGPHPETSLAETENDRTRNITRRMCHAYQSSAPALTARRAESSGRDQPRGDYHGAAAGATCTCASPTAPSAQHARAYANATEARRWRPGRRAIRASPAQGRSRNAGHVRPRRAGARGGIPVHEDTRPLPRSQRRPEHVWEGPQQGGRGPSQWSPEPQAARQEL